MIENNKKVEQSEAELEALEILSKSREKVGMQLQIDLDKGSVNEVDEFKKLLDRSFENPSEKYDIYYTGIRKLLMNNLPSGGDFQKYRQLIYDEKNIFLNLGRKKSDNNGVRGSDGRMTFNPVLEEMLNIISEWVHTSKNPFTLYKNLYFLNEKYNYGHEDYGPETALMAKAMLDLSDDN